MINTAAFPAVEITLWTLTAFSVATWALVLIKGAQHVRVSSGNRKFSKQFWSAPNLQAAAEIDGTRSSLGRLTASGFAALRDAGRASGEHDLEHSWDRHELLERKLRQQAKRERRTLEAGLAVLASIGSTAPFVGLFGTVWGIMDAMARIGRLGNASIDVVAGPIGEALIATGIGIAVAIPAVLSYNYFLRRLKTVSADLDDFADDFLSLAQRATYRIERGVRPLDVRTDHRFERRPESQDTERVREFERPQHAAGSSKSA